MISRTKFLEIIDKNNFNKDNVLKRIAENKLNRGTQTGFLVMLLNETVDDKNLDPNIVKEIYKSIVRKNGAYPISYIRSNRLEEIPKKLLDEIEDFEIDRLNYDDIINIPRKIICSNLVKYHKSEKLRNAMSDLILDAIDDTNYNLEDRVDFSFLHDIRFLGNAYIFSKYAMRTRREISIYGYTSIFNMVPEGDLLKYLLSFYEEGLKKNDSIEYRREIRSIYHYYLLDIYYDNLKRDDIILKHDDDISRKFVKTCLKLCSHEDIHDSEYITSYILIETDLLEEYFKNNPDDVVTIANLVKDRLTKLKLSDEQIKKIYKIVLKYANLYNRRSLLSNYTWDVIEPMILYSDSPNLDDIINFIILPNILSSAMSIFDRTKLNIRLDDFQISIKAKNPYALNLLLQIKKKGGD